MKKILSVDDEPGVLECMKASLEQYGYEMLTTCDPKEAGPLLDNHVIDLLMLDVRMPKMSGLEIFQELRRRNHKNIPVLFVTAYPGSFSMESKQMVDMWTHEFADGNTDILYKPFNINSLIEKVVALIGPPEDGRK